MKKVLLSATITILFLVGCSPSNENNIRLCDYKHMMIPEAVKEVPDHDLSIYITMDLFAKGVIIGKTDNIGLVECDDVVTLSMSANGQQANEYHIIIGAEEFGSQFDEYLIGKQIGDCFQYVLSGEEYLISIKDIAVYAEEVTDEIAQRFYGCASARQVLEDAKQEILKANISDYMYSFLIDNSFIRDYFDERDSYVDKVKRFILEDAVEEVGALDKPSEIEAYILTKYGEKLSDMTKGLEKSFDEFLILCEFMRNEGASVTDKELYEIYGTKEISDSSEREIFGVLGKEHALYELYYDDAHNILLNYYVT